MGCSVLEIRPTSKVKYSSCQKTRNGSKANQKSTDSTEILWPSFTLALIVGRHSTEHISFEVFLSIYTLPVVDSYNNRHTHTTNTCSFSCLIAIVSGWDEHFRLCIRRGQLLHDCSETEEIDVVLAALMFAQRHEGERETVRARRSGWACLCCDSDWNDWRVFDQVGTVHLRRFWTSQGIFYDDPKKRFLLHLIRCCLI